MSSKSISIARGLVLVGLTLGLAGGPAGAATAEGGYATADLARLADLLGQRGWHTRADGGGNLLVTRSGSGPQSPATPAQTPGQTPARSAPLVETSLLAERLPSHGWIVQRDAAGTLTLFPTTGGNRGLSRPEVAPEPAVDRWMAPLASRLEAGGWTVMRDAAAGLYFHREVVAPRPPGSLGQGTIASQAAVAQPAPDRLVTLGEGLRQHGWGVEPEAGGTLTLRPPAGLPATPPAAAAPERVAAPWEPQIREALTRRGWDLRRDAACNLLLIPTGMGQVSA
jgi:hypothetical protein